MDNLMTVKQLTAFLQVDRTTLWRWEKAGKLQSIKINGVRRYERETVMKFIRGEQS